MGATATWTRTAAVLEQDGKATLAMEGIRTALRGSQPAGIDTPNPGFDRIRFIRGTQFDPISGQVARNDVRQIRVVDINAAGVGRLVLQNQDETTTFRTLTRDVTLFTVVDSAINNTLAPNEVDVTIGLAVRGSGRPSLQTSVISTRGLGNAQLIEAESGAPAGGAWTPNNIDFTAPASSIPTDASGNLFIEVTPSGNTQRTLTYSFNIAVAGEYRMSWRIRWNWKVAWNIWVHPYIRDSYTWRIDGGVDRAMSHAFFPDWRWVEVDTIPLTAGLHTLVITWPKDPLKPRNYEALDAIFFTTESGDPPAL